MAMHDVEKATIRNGYQNAKRMRRRRRLMPLYIFTVLLLTALVGMALSMTVFFNIKQIRLTGSAPQHSKEEIVETAGISIGDNMVKLNAEKVKARLEKELSYVESVQIQKKFPNELTIDFKECRESYNVFFDNGILLTSSTGKIIANSAESADNLPVIYGFNPTNLEPGTRISSSDPIKNKIFDSFVSIMNTEMSVPITSIDMSDKYNIVVKFDNRIEFSMGNWNEISYKITLAEAVITRLGMDKEGVLTMVGNNQCSFRDKSSVDAGQTFMRDSHQDEQELEEDDEDDIVPDPHSVAIDAG